MEMQLAGHVHRFKVNTTIIEKEWQMHIHFVFPFAASAEASCHKRLAFFYWLESPRRRPR